LTVSAHIFTHIFPSLRGMTFRVFTQIITMGESPKLNISIPVFLPNLILAMTTEIIRIPSPPFPFIQELPQMLTFRRRTGLLRRIIFTR